MGVAVDISPIVRSIKGLLLVEGRFAEDRSALGDPIVVRFHESDASGGDQDAGVRCFGYGDGWDLTWSRAVLRCKRGFVSAKRFPRKLFSVVEVVVADVIGVILSRPRAGRGVFVPFHRKRRVRRR